MLIVAGEAGTTENNYVPGTILELPSEVGFITFPAFALCDGRDNLPFGAVVPLALQVAPIHARRTAPAWAVELANI